LLAGTWPVIATITGSQVFVPIFRCLTSAACPKAMPPQLAFGFPEDVCSLPAHSAGRGEQAASGLFPIALPIQLRMFIFCFSPVAHFPSRWIFAPRREGWIWQSNRFHHFPDCAGTVMIGQDN